MLLAAEKKRLRQEFTSWLQPMEKHALLIDNTRSCIKEIVDCAIATFEALPDEKRFKYDLFGGKDSLAMSLAMRPLRDDAFYVSPVGGFAAQVDFIEKQIASFNALKQQLESELDLFDNSSTCVRSRRLIFSYPSDFFVSDERRAEARGRLKNELCYANRMLNDFSVSLHSALQASDAQINDIVNGMKALIYLGLGYRKNEQLKIDKLISIAKNIDVSYVMSIRITVVRGGQLTKI